MLLPVLIACAPVGPDYVPPRSVLPELWGGVGVESVGSAAESLAHWWTLFNDPLLDSLIEQAVAANYDLKIAEARLRQARAQYRLSTATAAPSLELSGRHTETRRSGNVSGAASSQSLFETGFDAGWELDLFGGVRRATEAAKARLLAAGEYRNDVLISLEAEVARNYFELRGSQLRLLRIREQLAVQDRTLELVRGRWQSGFGTQLDVAQAETQQALTGAQLPALEASIEQARFRLAVLLGLPPLAYELPALRPLPLLPAPLPETLPSDLLRRRPDIRRAERELAAATADIGVATAELFPHFSLTGLIGLQSSSLSDLLSAGSRYWSVGPAVRWSLFDGGRVRAGIDLSQGLREEAQAYYEKTVLSALSEVEGALLALTRERETLSALTAAVDSGERAAALASGRYRAGLVGFLDVLQSEQAIYQARDQRVQSEQRLAVDLVALFKALGGGWKLLLSEAIAPAEQRLWTVPTIPLGEVK